MTSDNKVAIVTGGGRGIGGAIAHELHDEGYQLALMSPSGSAKKLADELGGIGVNGGCEDPNALEELVAKTMEAYGRIDSLVIHTGGPPKGELLDITDEDWLKGFDLLLLSVVRLSRLVTPVMEKQGKGSIVNITAAFALQPDIRYPVSSALRSSVSSFTKLYADRYAAKGIRMNSVMPGYIDSLSFPEETRFENPMQRIGTVSEIAKTAAFLLSDGAGFITGQNLPVDGGQVKRPQ